MAKIGIDFGTSYSTVSWVNPHTNRAQPIRINGKEKIPTMLYYPNDGGTPFVGDEAYAIYQQCRLTNNQDEIDEYLGGIFSGLKRNMNEEESLYLPNGRTIKYVDLIAEFLRYLKQETEKAFEGEKATDVCITYPVSHPDFKKRIMREAAIKAGFHKVKLLVEPVAAAMGYSNTFEYKDKSILVYDLGGGTFDIAYVQFDKTGDFKITLSPDGDANCGGEIIDRLLYDEWDKSFYASHIEHISKLEGMIDESFLKTDCMQQKEFLNKALQHTQKHVLRSVIHGSFCNMEIQKDKWESLISPVIDKTVAITKRMVETAKKESLTIDKTILIGGSSRIPQIAEKLNKVLPQPALPVNDVDVAVANGAAVFVNQGEIPVKKCFCRQCGHELTTKMKFCPYCGKNNIRYDYRFKDSQ